MAAWAKYSRENMRGRQVMIDKVRYRVVTHLRHGIWLVAAQGTGDTKQVELDFNGRVVGGRYGARSKKRLEIVSALRTQPTMNAHQIAAVMSVTAGAIGMVLSCMALEGVITYRTMRGIRWYALTDAPFKEFDQALVELRQRTQEMNQWQHGKRILGELKQHLSPSPKRASTRGHSSPAS